MITGILRHLFTIQELLVVPSPMGQPVETWQNIAANHEWYGSLSPLKEKEKPRENGAETAATVKIIMHYRDDITTSHRLVCDAKIYHLHSVIDPYDKKLDLHILASQKEGETYTP